MKALCVNCVTYTDCRQVPVGSEQGTQRDPYHETLMLCETREGALVAADLGHFHDRYSDERAVNRQDITPAATPGGVIET